MTKFLLKCLGHKVQYVYEKKMFCLSIGRSVKNIRSAALKLEVTFDKVKDSAISTENLCCQ